MGRRLFAVAVCCSLALASCGADDSKSLAEEAAEYRSSLQPREPLGTILLSPGSEPVVVRMGLDKAGVDRGGAAWYQETALPGEGRPISIAGHRTTHGAPFRELGELRRGDEVAFALPYATAIYEVVRSRPVSEEDISALTRGDTEELRLFASRIPADSKRLFVYARPSEIDPR